MVFRFVNKCVWLIGRCWLFFLWLRIWCKIVLLVCVKELMIIWLNFLILKSCFCGWKSLFSVLVRFWRWVLMFIFLEIIWLILLFLKLLEIVVILCLLKRKLCCLSCLLIERVKWWVVSRFCNWFGGMMFIWVFVLLIILFFFFVNILSVNRGNLSFFCW